MTDEEVPVPPKAKRPKRPPADSPKLIEAVFPGSATVVFWSAIAVAAALLASAVFARSSLSVVERSLFISVGFGILLAAYGSQATVATGRLIITGAGAIAVGLFLLMHNYLKQEDYVKGRIDGINAEKFQPFMKISDRIFGKLEADATRPARSSYEFIIFRRDITSPVLFVELQPKKPMGSEEEQENYPRFRIMRADIETKLGSTDLLAWEFREATNEIVDQANNKQIGIPIARVVEGGVPASFGLLDLPDWRFISSAKAGEYTDPADIPKLLDALQNDDIDLRRAARDMLAAVPVEAVPSLMQPFHSQSQVYRIRLGIVVALTEMLRRDKTLAKSVTEVLTPEDIEALVKAAGDEDRTVSIYATEFLYDLGDSRSVEPAIRMAAETSNSDARYNLLFLTQSGLLSLSTEARTAFSDRLSEIKAQSGAETQKLIEQLPVR